MNLMNISVADDQAKQWLSLNENRCDLGGERLRRDSSIDPEVSTASAMETEKKRER